MIFLIFIFGLIIGSFINCIVYRFYVGESFIKGRSYCPNCKHQLGFWDLIPIFSFLILKGKCRYCHKKISWQYPLVEIITAITFCLVYFLSVPGIIILARNLFFSAVLIIIFIFDFKYLLVADKIVVPSIFISFLLNLIVKMSWQNLLLGAIIGSSFFLIQYLISKGEWIGSGDIYIGALMGVMLGFKNVILALILAYIIGSIVALLLVAFKKEGWKSKIPLGPFLAIGTIISLFFGEKILQWYLGGIFF